MLWPCLIVTRNARDAERRGWEVIPGVKKLDCQICKGFMPAKIQQLSTPTYKSRKEREQKAVTDSPTSTTPHSCGAIRGYSFGAGRQ